MDVNQDVIGKTITGIIAMGTKQAGAREIWMLQFSDGTHVEFVSPAAKRALRRSTRRASGMRETVSARNRQLALNVA